MESFHLFMHEGKLDFSTPLLEILAVEIHNEVSYHSAVVFNSVMLWGLCATITIRSEKGITAPVFPFPISLQIFPVPHDETSAMEHFGT